MATVISTTTISNSSDAAYRLWGADIGTRLAALGLVKTSDTGQIVWASAVHPGTLNTAGGFEIYRFDDALQSTAPVFIKLEFGTGTGSTGYAGLWITVGTGTDGAGTLTGQVSTRVAFALGNLASTSSYYSVASNRLAIQLAPALAGASTLIVERTHDTSGSDTADGILLLCACPGPTAFSQVIPMTGTIPAQMAHWNVALPPTGTGAFGNDVYLYPVRAWGPAESSPILGCYLYFTANLTSLNPVTAACWDGASRLVNPMGATNSGTYYGGIGYIALRWD